MKIASSIIGFFCLVFMTLAALFKVQHYPGGSIMLIFSLGIFSTIFIPIYFISRVLDAKSVLDKIANVTAIFSLSCFFLGLLFKIQHYPGASMLLSLGVLLLILPTGILMLVSAIKNESTIGGYLKSIVLFGFVIAWIFFFGFVSFTGETVSQILFIDEELNSSFQLIENHPDVALEEIMSNELLTASDKELFVALNNKRKEITSFIDDRTEMLITKTGGKSYDAGISRGNWNVLGLKDSDVTSYIMLGQGNALELKSMLAEYDQLAFNCLNVCGNKFEIKNASNLLLRNPLNKPWEVSLFDHTPLFVTLPILTSVKVRLVVTELSLLKCFSEGTI